MSQIKTAYKNLDKQEGIVNHQSLNNKQLYSLYQLPLSSILEILAAKEELGAYFKNIENNKDDNPLYKRSFACNDKKMRRTKVNCYNRKDFMYVKKY